MTTHKLKTWPRYFQATKMGEKLFELREDDRSYKVGDILLLQEYIPEEGSYTGEELEVKVTFVLTHVDFPIVPITHVIMGIEHPGQKAVRKAVLEAFYDEEQGGFPEYDPPSAIFDESCWGGDLLVELEDSSALDHVLTFCGNPPFEIAPNGDCENCARIRAWFPTVDTLDAPCVTCKKPKMTKFLPIVEILKEQRTELKHAILEAVEEYGDVELLYLSDLIEEREPRFTQETIRSMIWEMVDRKALSLINNVQVRLP